MSSKKSGNPWGVIFVLAAIGGLAYLGYTHPEYPAGVIAFFKGGAPEPFVPGPTLGTEDNPFDWSTWDNQVSTAPTLPEEGAQVYIRTASGNVRLVKAGEIKAAKDAYGKTKGVPAKPAGSPAKKDVPVVHQTTSVSSVHTSAPESSSAFKIVEVPPIPVPRDMVPQYAIEKAEQYKKSFLAENVQSASDLQYRFFYNEKGEACLEYTVTPKGGYTWATPTWVGFTWGNTSGSIGNREISYTATKKKRDEAEYRMEERRKDPVFREIEALVLKIATDYDYDYYGAYKQKVKYRDPQVKKAVCDGYATATVHTFATHPLVHKVETWTGGNHAWNVLILKDGRKLYCDATWYDGNNVDEEGYVVHIPNRNPVDLTFDREEFNSLGGAVDKGTGRLLAVHGAWSDAKIRN